MSKSEIRGMCLLLIFCIFLIFIPFVQRSIYTSDTPTFEIIIDTNAATIPENKLANGGAVKKESPTTQSYATLSEKVHISKITLEELQSIGVPSRIAKNIIKYQEKGGRFHKTQDLHKIYGMDEETVRRIVHNTLWEEPMSRSEPKIRTVPISKERADENIKLDVNKADTAAFANLKGIGGVLAQRIVKYRDKLGGFVRLEQLAEVYGISEFALSEIQKHTFIEKNFKPKALTINHIELDQLSAHPYIGYKKSRVIYNYLKNHSKLVDFNDFQKSYPFTDKELGNIKEYISYE